MVVDSSSSFQFNDKDKSRAKRLFGRWFETQARNKQRTFDIYVRVLTWVTGTWSVYVLNTKWAHCVYELCRYVLIIWRIQFEIWAPSGYAWSPQMTSDVANLVAESRTSLKPLSQTKYNQIELGLRANDRDEFKRV